MALTDQQLAEIEQRAKRATTELGDVCAEGPGNRWRMSVPANPERDTDLILDTAIGNTVVLLAEVRDQAGRIAELEGEQDRLRAELAEARGEIDGLHESVAAAEQVVTEMVGMVGPPVHHYASRLRATLGLHDPNPCRCYACKQGGGGSDA